MNWRRTVGKVLDSPVTGLRSPFLLNPALNLNNLFVMHELVQGSRLCMSTWCILLWQLVPAPALYVGYLQTVT